MATAAKPLAMATEPTPIVIDQVTILSLLLVVALLAIAYVVSLRSLVRATPTSLRILFIWHLFDALIHFVFEGSYLYNVFFAHAPNPAYDATLPLTAETNFLGHPERLYGSAYATNPFGTLWMVYADADKRWAGVDLTVISLELLTVFLGGPLALYVAWGIAARRAEAGWWMTVLATAELYGGWMTFCPEWLTGSLNLDTSNFMFLWIYLVLFNGLWVIMPLFAMYIAYKDMANAFGLRGRIIAASMAQRKKTR